MTIPPAQEASVPPRRVPRSVALARERERRTWLPRLAAAALGALAVLPVAVQAASLALQDAPATFRLAPGRVFACEGAGGCVRVVSGAEVALWLALVAGGGLVLAGAALGRGRLLRLAVWAAPVVVALLALVQAGNAVALRGEVSAGVLRDAAGSLLVVGLVATAVGWLAWRVDPVARP